MISVVMVLAVKLLLAPSFVVGASLATRRFGASVGGVLAALPVVAGAILLAYALEHGRAFAAHAALGTLLGVLSLTAFVLVYGRLAGYVTWPACMLVGWLAFLAGTLILDGVAVPAGVALVAVLAGLGVGGLLLPRPSPTATMSTARPIWDLPLRAGCALALVVALTTTAGWLGPQLSGLLAPFPIITTVMAVFTQAQHGGSAAVRLLRGMLSGFVGFVLFCFVLTIALRSLSTAAAFIVATGAALAMQTATLSLTRRRLAAGAHDAGLGSAARALVREEPTHAR